MKPRAALYARISLDRSGDELGVARQREDCLRLAEARGWDVTAEYTDNDTSAAGKVQRPGFEALLTAIAAGSVDVVIAWNLDRLTRNRRDTVRLIELGQEHRIVIALARGTDLDMSTPMGRMMADQLGGWARYEIEQKSDRQVRANVQQAARGLPYGRGPRPYGYEPDQLTVRESEAAVLREMAKRLIRGESYKDIAVWLNKAGHRTSTGNTWRAVRVRNVLREKRYGGIREYDGVEYKGSWEPVFDPLTYERLQTALRLRAQMQPVGGFRPAPYKYLLSGLVFCGVCGWHLSGSRRLDHPGDKWVQTFYKCHMDRGRPSGCGKVRRSAEPLEAWVKACVMYRLDTDRLGKLLRLNIDDQNDKQLAESLTSRNEHAGRVNSLVDDYASGLLTRDQFARAKATAEARLAELDKQIAALTRERTAVDIPAGQTVRAAWEAAESDAWRRSLLSLLIKRIVVHPGQTGSRFCIIDGKRYRFSPELISIEWVC